MPVTASGVMNCAMAYAMATVVRSLMVTALSGSSAGSATAIVALG
jgi:hypothetical protein